MPRVCQLHSHQGHWDQPWLEKGLSLGDLPWQPRDTHAHSAGGPGLGPRWWMRPEDPVSPRICTDQPRPSSEAATWPE